jgi:two-component system nitrate/nitrite response regulator NarL
MNEHGSTVQHGNLHSVRPHSYQPRTGDQQAGPRSVRIVVADDHTLLREAICELLGLEPGFEVVGEGGDGEEAVELAARLRPDIVLLDVEMPRNVPGETVRAIKAGSPASRVIMLTGHDSPQLVREMLEAGVAGYLHKSIGRQGLTAAIRGALEGDRNGGGRRLVMSVTQGSLMADPAPSKLISPRERQILVLVAAAFSNRQIASRLKITEATVKRHLRNAFEKLGAVSRIDAVNRATAAGLIHPQTNRQPGEAYRSA